jgi:uncharacterized protein involved in type VI secretion and phage assembly
VQVQRIVSWQLGNTADPLRSQHDIVELVGMPGTKKECDEHWREKLALMRGREGGAESCWVLDDETLKCEAILRKNNAF